MLGMIYISAPILLIINLNKNYDEKECTRSSPRAPARRQLYDLLQAQEERLPLYV